MKAFLITLLWVVLIGDALLLVLIVLLQSGRGGGLSGMLGGGGGAESALGPKTGLPRITGWMAGIFFFCCVLIGILSRDESVLDPKKVAKGSTPTAAGPQDPGAKPKTADESEKPSTAEAPKPSTAKAPGTATAPKTSTKPASKAASTQTPAPNAGN